MKNKIQFVILTALLFTLVFSGCKEIPEMDDTIAATVDARSVSREEVISRVKFDAILTEKSVSISELIKDYIEEQELIDRLKGTEYDLSKTYDDYYREAEENYRAHEAERQREIRQYSEKYGIDYSEEECIFFDARFQMYAEASGKYVLLFYDAHKEELENMTIDEVMDALYQHLETFRPASEKIRFNEKVTAQIISEFREMGITVER